MTTDDVSAVLDVRMSTVENSITLERLEKDYGITPNSIVDSMNHEVAGWLCQNSDLVVGFSMGDRSNGEVQVVAVRPTYEGLGIGRNLLHRVQEWLFSEGHEQIWLRSNPDPGVRAYGFYRRLGWETTAKALGGDEILIFRMPES